MKKLAKYKPDDVIWDSQNKHFGVVVSVVGDNDPDDDNCYIIVWTVREVSWPYDIAEIDNQKRYRLVGNLAQFKTLMDRVRRSGHSNTITVPKSVAEKK